jgi:hypothetical protein
MRSRHLLFVLSAICALATANVASAGPSVADYNLFWGTGVSGVTATGSSWCGDTYMPPNAINGLSGADQDFVFAPGDGAQTLSISGFNSGVSSVRVWTGGDIPVNMVGIWGSTTATTSLNTADYSPLVNLTYIDSGSKMAGWTATETGYYRDFNVNAPTGTQSVLLHFGASHGPGLDPGNSGTGFARVQEVQAMAGYNKAINLDIDAYNTNEAPAVTYTGAGVAGAGVWNSYGIYTDVSGGNVTPAQSGNLQYSDGSASTVKFALSECNPDNQTSHSGGLNALMDDYIGVKQAGITGNNPESTTFTLSGLNPSTKYSLYLYGQPSTWTGCMSTFTVKGSAKTTNGAGFDGIFGEGRDFVTFNVKARPDGTLTGTLTSPQNFGLLNGFQLVENGTEAVSVYEGNLLTNKPVVTSSQFNTDTYAAINAVDGEGGDGAVNNDFVFANNDADQRLIVHGFNSEVKLVRVWTGSDIPPLVVTIKSSTEDLADVNSFTGSSVTTLVDAAPLANGWKTDWEGRWYRDFIVNALAGTQSLFFDFGDTNGNPNFGPGAGFARILEVQAFAVPEPSVIALFATGLVGLLAYAWRKRK